VLDLDQLLRSAVEQRASDLHLKVGTRPWVRVDGTLVEAPFDTIEPGDTDDVAARIIPAAQADAFREAGDAEFVYAVQGLGRFRVSAFHQRGHVGFVLCRIVPGVPGIDALGLPPVLATLMEANSGLVLVTGLAGSGRTSTVAALVDHINASERHHIVTIDDPIEVVHPDKASIIDQREVGVYVASVSDALARVVRQDPDLIVVGELGEPEAARRLLEAADTGASCSPPWRPSERPRPSTASSISSPATVRVPSDPCSHGPSGAWSASGSSPEPGDEAAWWPPRSSSSTAPSPRPSPTDATGAASSSS